MLLTLPDFKNTHCVSMTACGEVQKASPALLKWMHKQNALISPIGSGSEKGFLRASFGGQSGSHLHIDVTKSSMFPKGYKPKISTDLDAVQKSLSRFIGMDVVTDFTGRFEIDQNELPDGGIIRSLFFQTKTGDVAIKVAGSVFSITGAPINLISWRILNGDTIGVQIESENQKMGVKEDYLTAALHILESSLNVFVLAKTPNEQKK